MGTTTEKNYPIETIDPNGNIVKIYRDLSLGKKLMAKYNVRVNHALVAEIVRKDNQNNPQWD